MKKHIPNILTCCNLLSGCLSIAACEPGLAAGFIVLGAVFDFFDGFAARLLHVSSPIGKELDSLADCVTFGLAPAFMVYHALLAVNPVSSWLYIPVFLIAAFSALRLAKFNLDERQTTSFIGLPTPANALFWGGISLALTGAGSLPHPTAIAILVLAGIPVSCYLLVSEIPMFSLKFKHFGWRGNELRYLFIALSAALIALSNLVACYTSMPSAPAGALHHTFISFVPIVVLYVAISAIKGLLGKR